MRTSSVQHTAISFVLAATLTFGVAATPCFGQTAIQAALGLANLMDGAGGGISREEQVAALEDAAEAGQPIALWRLGLMYENGEGVQKDQVKAFGYFSRIANDNANTPPKSLEADIVAQSFVKVGQYYRDGLPGAGIKADSHRSHTLFMHAASYFRDADAQYLVARLFLDDDGLGENPLQSARWLTLAARKGHAAAQASLGDMLFNGVGIEAQPVEGLMWLSVAQHHALGTPEEATITELLNRAMSVASPEDRAAGVNAAESLSPLFGGY